MKNLIIFITFFFLSNQISLAIPPVAKNASPEVKVVLSYLNDIFGNKILSAQHTARGPRNDNDDLEYIHQITEKYPAIIGIDVGIYTEKFTDGYEEQLHNVYLDAKDYWQEGGLVTLCWHWGNPMENHNSYDNTKKEFDIAAALQDGTPENQALIADLDMTASVLKKLRDANVPILWRPLHETGGGWFWWSKKGKDQFQELWKFMFDYYNNEHQLNNLIWVYAASNKLKLDWYPGHEYADIIGADFYNLEQMIDPERFNKLKDLADGRPIALTEHDMIPSINTLIENNCLWAWFMPWHTEWLRKNSPEKIKETYHHELVIIRDELPEFVRTR